MAKVSYSALRARSRPTKSLKLVIPPIYLLAIAVGLALIGLYVVLTAGNLGPGTDLRQFLTRSAYPAFLTGGKLVASGEGAQLYDLALQERVQREILAPYFYGGGVLPYNHLPFLAVLLAPLAGLPLEWSWAIWAGATLLALIAALVLLSRQMRAAAQNPIEAKWAVVAFWALALSFFPVYQELTQSQTSAWVLLGYSVALTLLNRKRERQAGLAFASGLLKPQLLPVPLLILLIERRWRALGAFLALAAALALLVTPFLGGPGWIFSYLGLLGGLVGGAASGNIQPTLMENLRGLFTLLALRLDAQGSAAPWILPAMALATLAFLALLVWVWLKPDGAGTIETGSAAWLLRWAAVVLTGLLVSPHLLGYELTAWILVGVLVWRAARQPGGPPIRQAALLLGVGYFLGTISLTVVSTGLLPLHLGALFMVAAIPLLLLWSRRAASVTA